MRIFLTGATGFIGGHLLRALCERGHAITCLARGEGARRLAAMALPGLRVVEGKFTRPAGWVDQVAGHDAVVNSVGIIRETRAASFEAVHTDAPTALFEAAARSGARKAVQLSALGADDKAESRYLRTKGAADTQLPHLGIPYVVLRPSIVYGPGDHSMSLFLSLAALPVTPVPGDGQYPLQPVHVEDLVRAVVQAVERDELSGVAVDVVGAEPVTFSALLDELARWLGRPRGARKLSIPWGMMQMAAAVTDALGGRGPITREELALLRRGSTAEVGPLVEQFGFVPASVSAGLARQPRTQAVVWHARLAPLRTPLRLSVALVWLASGVVSVFLYPLAESRALLAEVGLSGTLADLALYGSSALDVLLGLALAAGYRVRQAGTVSLVVLLGYMVILTVAIPSFWWHPFGPLTKNVPFIAATLVMMALEE
jgi:uncharacterized protein YbjT (DUF2867 family)/uncharacterized membrane protein YphA (DoxX/SURF4 family)